MSKRMEEYDESENKSTVTKVDEVEVECSTTLGQSPPHSFSRKRKSSPSIDLQRTNEIKSKKLKQDCYSDLNNKQTLVAERASLQKLQCQKQETLRQLRLVKLYRTKNNLPQLQKLIDKWRAACQQSVTELQGRMPEPKPNIKEVLHLWQLDENLLQYKPDEESF